MTNTMNGKTETLNLLNKIRNYILSYDSDTDDINSCLVMLGKKSKDTNNMVGASSSWVNMTLNEAIDSFFSGIVINTLKSYATNNNVYDAVELQKVYPMLIQELAGNIDKSLDIMLGVDISDLIASIQEDAEPVT